MLCCSSNIAWEVRKTTSPGKKKSMGSHQVTPSPPPPSPLQFPRPCPPLNLLGAVPGGKAAAKYTKQSQKEPGDSPPDAIPVHVSPTLLSGKSGSQPNSARSLDFGNVKPKNHDSSRKPPSVEPKPEPHVGLPTWADRVKGVTSKPHPLVSEAKKNVAPSVRRVSEGCLEEEEEEEEDGWETVSRSRTRSAGAAGNGGGGGRQGRANNYSSKPEEAGTDPKSPGETDPCPRSFGEAPTDPSPSSPENVTADPSSISPKEDGSAQQPSQNGSGSKSKQSGTSALQQLESVAGVQEGAELQPKPCEKEPLCRESGSEMEGQNHVKEDDSRAKGADVRMRIMCNLGSFVGRRGFEVAVWWGWTVLEPL